MKLAKLVTAVFFFFPVLANASDIPKFFLSSSRFFDGECATRTKTTVNPDWKAELNQRLAEFQTTWDAEATQLIKTLYSVTGKGFNRQELSVTLFICEMSSMYDPLMVNVRDFLVSYRTPRPTLPMLGFVDLVFHEFIHNFLRPNLAKETPLLRKYQAENSPVRVHLHLMALQIEVYKSLNLQDRLAWLDSKYKKIGGDYGRAWQIVTQLENYRDFIAEVRQ